MMIFTTLKHVPATAIIQKIKTSFDIKQDLRQDFNVINVQKVMENLEFGRQDQGKLYYFSRRRSLDVGRKFGEFSIK